MELNLTDKLSPRHGVKTVSFDPRCEYDVPMFCDLTKAFQEDFLSSEQEVAFTNWFDIPHDFKVSRKITPQFIK